MAPGSHTSTSASVLKPEEREKGQLRRAKGGTLGEGGGGIAGKKSLEVGNMLMWPKMRKEARPKQVRGGRRF